MSKDQPDARRLTPEAKETLRLRAAQAVEEEGMTQGEAAEAFQVSRGAVNGWVRKYRAGGAAALKSKPLGRPRRSRLAGHEAATAVRLITDRCPDQLKLPFALWTREAVCNLLAERFDLHISVWTAGRYLAKWGLTPQKPIRRAYEQDPEAVRHWLEAEYPAIRKRAKREGAEIHWGDEMGIRSDHQAGRTYGKKGKTPVVPATGKRFGCQMISTITNRGTLRFMVFDQRFSQDVMIEFLRRLLRSVDTKVFLIVDQHPGHCGRRLKRWVSERKDALELFYLPGYSPELNPDEVLNQDVKSRAGRQRPTNQSELMGSLRSYLRSTQRRPSKVRSYFQEEHVKYAS